MNYRHLYHAGNFSDVLKHIVMIALLRALTKKETPFCFLDTHAGIGLYPLQSIETQKSREYESGIANLLARNNNNAPELIKEYIAIINDFNAGAVQKYLGSPLIAEKYLRDQDQLILCELHSTDIITLKENMPKRKNIAIHHTDAYLGMKAFLPPKLKRGIVMIDPPFELPNEFERIENALKRALTHWQSGHYMIWYPIKDQKKTNQFYRSLRDLQKPTLCIEFELVNPPAGDKLSCCGIALVNPPWQVEEMLKLSILPYLATALIARWRIVTERGHYNNS